MDWSIIPLSINNKNLESDIGVNAEKLKKQRNIYNHFLPLQILSLKGPITYVCPALSLLSL